LNNTTPKRQTLLLTQANGAEDPAEVEQEAKASLEPIIAPSLAGEAPQEVAAKTADRNQEGQPSNRSNISADQAVEVLIQAEWTSVARLTFTSVPHQTLIITACKQALRSSFQRVLTSHGVLTYC
jgi:hypothetical protein